MICGVGSAVGIAVGTLVGAVVGSMVGTAVGTAVGASVGATVGTFVVVEAGGVVAIFPLCSCREGIRVAGLITAPQTEQTSSPVLPSAVSVGAR